MRRLAHIVNPFTAASPPQALAQDVTLESMRVARDHAGLAEVDLLTAQFAEDRSIIPDGFVATVDLDRSVLDCGNFASRRRLPILADILYRLFEASDAEYLIYTNIDIGVVPSFYDAVCRLIDRGFDAFSITRRTLSTDYSSVDELPLMVAEVGKPHPGTDCFVFPRRIVPDLRLGEACLGAFLIAKNFQLNLICNSSRYRKFTDLHLTFHLGDDRAWLRPEFEEFSRHNEREVTKALRHYHRLGALPDRLGFSSELESLLRLLHWKRRLPRTVRLVTRLRRLLGPLRRARGSQPRF